VHDSVTRLEGTKTQRSWSFRAKSGISKHKGLGLSGLNLALVNTKVLVFQG